MRWTRKGNTSQFLNIGLIFLDGAKARLCLVSGLTQSVRTRHYAIDRQLRERSCRLIWLPLFGSARKISLPSKAIQWLHERWLRHRGLVNQVNFT